MGQKIMQVSEVFLDSVADTLLLASEGLKLWTKNDRNQSKEFSCLVISLYTQPFPSGKGVQIGGERRGVAQKGEKSSFWAYSSSSPSIF